MKTSTLFAIDLKDLTKGIVVAAGGAAIAAIQNVLSSGSLTFNWKSIGITALAAGLSYLVKNFFTPARLVQNAGTDSK